MSASRGGGVASDSTLSRWELAAALRRRTSAVSARNAHKQK